MKIVIFLLLLSTVCQTLSLPGGELIIFWLLIIIIFNHIYVQDFEFFVDLMLRVKVKAWKRIDMIVYWQHLETMNS